ncbi:hypothetical protein B0H14DRAFT_3738178 [Mycena olivaceomarginata]|nr:hypothetical protein B0H14DRAFT_3738178 [Mycena olivaceomarginata]
MEQLVAARFNRRDWRKWPFHDVQLGMGLGGFFGGVISDSLGWRTAFLLQAPLYLTSFSLTSYNLRYVTPGQSNGAKGVLKRIDYFGSLTLLISIGSLLLFLSTRYNETLPWSNAWVFTPLAMTCIFSVLFVIVEVFVASDPVLSPTMMRQKVPLLVGASNFLSATCNFSITYFFPMWFPGRHPRKRLHCRYLHLFSSVVPLGFGNSAVLQTNLIALLAHLPESQMAIGTGFAQLFRGLVDSENSPIERFHSHSPRRRKQRAARDSYAVGLKTVYVMAACATLLAYIARLPIPDQDLDAAYARRRQDAAEAVASSPENTRVGNIIDDSRRLTHTGDGFAQDDACSYHCLELV